MSGIIFEDGFTDEAILSLTEEINRRKLYPCRVLAHGKWAWARPARGPDEPLRELRKVRVDGHIKLDVASSKRAPDPFAESHGTFNGWESYEWPASHPADFGRYGR